MAKGRKRGNSADSNQHASSISPPLSGNPTPQTPAQADDQPQQEGLDQLQLQPISFQEWVLVDRRGMHWVLLCILLGAALGFSLGAGYLDSNRKQTWANFIRSTPTYKILTGQESWSAHMERLFDNGLDRFAEWATRVEREMEEEEYASHPAHPRVFAVLREAMVREPGGCVHPDLWFFLPLPCGAMRGVGMVRDAYHH
jgi:hypothetical protein